MAPRVPLLAALLLAACTTEEDGGAPATTIDAGATTGARSIEPGVKIGVVTLGATYADVARVLGPASALPSSGLFFAQYKAEGLEVLFTSPKPSTLEDDAIVLGVTATSAAAFDGTPRPGQSRAEIEAVLGAPTETIGRVDYWSTGVSIEFSKDVAFRIGVFAPYALSPKPPPMAAARVAKEAP